jgi:hypothetical protein
LREIIFVCFCILKIYYFNIFLNKKYFIKKLTAISVTADMMLDGAVTAQFFFLIFILMTKK